MQEEALRTDAAAVVLNLLHDAGSDGGGAWRGGGGRWDGHLARLKRRVH